MKKWIPKLVLVILGLILIVTCLFLYLDGQTKYNDKPVNGNTGGNLYNGGLFCESNGTVFFANPDDSFRLYSMNPNGTNIKKLTNDIVQYINADDHYVYYIRNNSISVDFTFFSFDRNSLCRVNRDGSHLKVLDDNPCLYPSLIGNKIYYLHNDKQSATTLYEVGIDGSDRKQAKKEYTYTCSAIGDSFYYGGSENSGDLFRYDTKTDRATSIFEGNCYQPVAVTDTTFYYLDAGRNNVLVYLKLNEKESVTLTTDSVETYNIYGDYIYYQKYDKENGNALCMIKTDGTGQRTLATGNYHCINVTSYYIYFLEYGTNNMFYTSSSNPGELSLFHPGTEK